MYLCLGSNNIANYTKSAFCIFREKRRREPKRGETEAHRATAKSYNTACALLNAGRAPPRQRARAGGVGKIMRRPRGDRDSAEHRAECGARRGRHALSRRRDAQGQARGAAAAGKRGAVFAARTCCAPQTAPSGEAERGRGRAHGARPT